MRKADFIVDAEPCASQVSEQEVGSLDFMDYAWSDRAVVLNVISSLYHST